MTFYLDDVFAFLAPLLDPLKHSPAVRDALVVEVQLRLANHLYVVDIGFFFQFILDLRIIPSVSQKRQIP